MASVKNVLRPSSLLFSLWLAPMLAFGQSVQDSLQLLYEAGAHQRAIQFGQAQAHQLDAGGWFYLGLSYYQQSAEQDAIRCFDRALHLDKGHVQAHFYKGCALFYQNQFEAAGFHLGKACRLQPLNADYASFLAEAYAFQGQLDSAIYYGQRAIQATGAPGKIYLLLGQLLFQQNQPDGAVHVLEQGLQDFEPSDPSYPEILYNLAQMYYLTGQFKPAEQKLEHYIKLEPDEYRAVAKLIQIYYAQEKYEKGNALKQILYAAFQRGEIPPDMRTDGFCFDQFTYEGKKILAFEYFLEEGSFFCKHVFYVTNQAGEIESTIQTESSPAVLNTGKKYALTKSENGMHYTFAAQSFENNPDYVELKKGVLRILKGKEKATWQRPLEAGN